MNQAELLQHLRETPLIASVQASDGSPLADPQVLLASARASLQEGVQVLRLEGADAIRVIRGATGAPTIGLIKRRYPDSEVYITPTLAEVETLIELGCEIIALDATLRHRPEGASLRGLVDRVRAAGRLAMADCDTLESVQEAGRLGFDIVSTTLRGYTASAPATSGPDLDFVRQARAAFPGILLAEGRFEEPWQVQAAMRIGAGVVIGGALNDPIKQTRRFLAARPIPGAKVGAVDIGGTWLRFGLFSSGELQGVERVALPDSREARLDWIREQVLQHGVERVGVSTGGVVDPSTGIVTEAKPIIPDHVGSEFSERTLSVPTRALNDGLATAWGHACLPEFAGKRVATLALGTGVGAGLVDRGRVVMGPGGEYPRLNDLPVAPGASVEDLLGGAALSESPGPQARADAQRVADWALQAIQALWMPDLVVVCGGVGLSEWLSVSGAVASPYGADAGLYGAYWLACAG